MKERVLQLLCESDSFAAIEFATTGVDAMSAVTTLDELARDLYWKQKNLAASLAVGRAAAQHALISSANSPAQAEELRGKAKAICYNIASFAWRGWGEEGITITSSDELIGMDAARANLRLAIELGKGDLPLSRAYWILGAHQISAGTYESAVESFQKAASHARSANEQGEACLAEAFGRLTEFLGRRDDRSLFLKTAEAVKKLGEVKDGSFFVGQVSTALKIYYPACEAVPQEAKEEV
jgi:tetratricopeptide (TPR) repeat protein